MFGTALGKQAPLWGAAVYLNFISQYGAVIVTTLAIIYSLINIVKGILDLMERRRKRQKEIANEQGSK